MGRLIQSLKGTLAGLAWRMDRANANRQRWMMGLPVDTADTQSREPQSREPQSRGRS